MAERKAPVDLAKILALAEADPAAAAKLIARLDRYIMRPHSGQQTVLDDPARFKILNCGRRWGKTMVGAKSIVERAKSQNKVLWWVAPTYRIVKRGYAEVLKQLPPDLLVGTPPPDTNFDAGRSVILKLKNGTRIEFYSATMPESMLGASVDYVILDEAATMKPNIWQQIISPTLMDRRGEAMFISTPRGLNWFYLEYQKGQDPAKSDFASWTFTSHDNPFLPPGEVERMSADLPQLEVDQEILAKFLAPGSAVFLVPDKAKQQARVLDNGLLVNESTDQPYSVRGENVIIGVDLGKQRDFTVIYGARASDRRNVFFERSNKVSWGEQKRRIRRAIYTLKKAGAAEIMVVIDSTGLGDPILDDLEMLGLDVIGVNFSGQHKPNMVKLLARDLERAHAFVLDDEFVDLEFQAYTMQVTPGGRYTYSAPEGMHDDVVSAKMLQHHGLVNEGVANVMTLSPGDAGPTPEQQREADPFDDPEADDAAWDDLVDEEPTDDLRVAAEEVGLVSPAAMTLHEMLVRGLA